MWAPVPAAASAHFRRTVMRIWKRVVGLMRRGPGGYIRSKDLL